MYTEKNLKLYAVEVIKESKLPTKDKLFLLKELQKSDYHRTMDFLNNGQFYFGNVNNNKRNLIEETFFYNVKIQESIDAFLTEMGPSPMLSAGKKTVEVAKKVIPVAKKIADNVAKKQNILKQL